MSTKTHKKLCWSCDGYVHVYEMQCPYCGANLVEREKVELEESEPAQTVDPVAPPPYHSYGHMEPLSEEIPSVPLEKEPSQDVESPLATLLLLIPGSIFFILGCALWLFSSEGVLSFTFKAKYWPLFLLSSLPLLYFGYRSLFSPKEPVQEELSPFDVSPL